MLGAAYDLGTTADGILLSIFAAMVRGALRRNRQARHDGCSGHNDYYIPLEQR